MSSQRTNLPWIRRDVWACGFVLDFCGLRGCCSNHRASRRAYHAASGRAEVRYRTPTGAAQRANRAATGTPHRPHRAAPSAAYRTRRATGRSRRHPGRCDDHRAKEVVRSSGKAQRPGRLNGGPEGPTARGQRRLQKAGGAIEIAFSREGRRGRDRNFGIIALYACFARRRNGLNRRLLDRRIHQALKPLILLAPATVHGVVFEVFDSGGHASPLQARCDGRQL